MKYDESLRTPEVRLKEAEQIGAQLRQVLRYLHALEPALNLAGLLTGKSAAVRVFNETPRVHRVHRVHRVYKSRASFSFDGTGLRRGFSSAG